MENSTDTRQELAARAATLSAADLLSSLSSAYQQIATAALLSDAYTKWHEVRIIAEREILARLEAAQR